MNDYRKKAELLMKLGDAEIAEKRRRTAIIRRTVGGICGLCAAAAIGFGVWNSTALKGALTPDPDHGYADVTETHPTTEITTTAPLTTTSSTTQPTSTAPPTTESSTASETHATAPNTTFPSVTTAVPTTTPELTTTESQITPVSPEHPVDTPERWEDLPINERFSRFEADSGMEFYPPPKDVYTSTGETMSEENIVRFVGMTKLTAVDPDTGITHETTAERFSTREFNVCALRFSDDENYYIYELTNTRTEVPDPKEGIL